MISSDGRHRVRGAGVPPPPRAGEVPCPLRHRGDFTWGVGSGHSQWYVQVGMVEHLRCLWLLWGIIAKIKMGRNKKYNREGAASIPIV